jgi:hypothetical protein
MMRGAGTIEDASGADFPFVLAAVVVVVDVVFITAELIVIDSGKVDMVLTAVAVADCLIVIAVSYVCSVMEPFGTAKVAVFAAFVADADSSFVVVGGDDDAAIFLIFDAVGGSSNLCFLLLRYLLLIALLTAFLKAGIEQTVHRMLLLLYLLHD